MTATEPHTPSKLPEPSSADPEITIPWRPHGFAMGALVVVLMVGGSIPFLLQSGSLAVVLMGVLFIFFASAIAGAIVYTSTLDG